MEIKVSLVDPETLKFARELDLSKVPIHTREGRQLIPVEVAIDSDMQTSADILSQLEDRSELRKWVLDLVCRHASEMAKARRVARMLLKVHQENEKLRDAMNHHFGDGQAGPWTRAKPSLPPIRHDDDAGPVEED